MKNNSLVEEENTMKAPVAEVMSYHMYRTVPLIMGEGISEDAQNMGGILCISHSWDHRNNAHVIRSWNTRAFQYVT